MEAVITDENIGYYVKSYLTGKKWRLPVSLRDVKIGDWDVSKVTNMADLFRYKFEFGDRESRIPDNRDEEKYYRSFNEPLNWNVENVEDMRTMFYGCHAFNQDLSQWNVSKVNDFDDIFRESGMKGDNLENTLKSWRAQGKMLGGNRKIRGRRSKKGKRRGRKATQKRNKKV